MQLKRIQNLNSSELDQIVNLHYSLLKESFINNFGRNFLEIVYQNIPKDDNNIFLIVKDRDKLIGFALATFNGDQFNSTVISKNFLTLSAIVIKTSILKPKVMMNLTKWYLTKSNVDKLKPELQFIAIDSNYQRKGLGKKLITLISSEFKTNHIKNYRVGTKANNIKSNNFYKKNNFTLTHQESFFGDTFNYYLSPNLY